MENEVAGPLTLGLALGAGVLAQILARHLRIPGIVVLLAVGVLLGPEVTGLLHPEALGAGMHILVGFAVAIILFEGGMSLDLRSLRRQQRSIQQMVWLGAVVTAVGGTVVARLLLDWPWGTSALFGTLVIVTGPTVVTPLLRRMRVRRRVATVLEAEGVFGDAVGAIIAVVSLGVVLGPHTGDAVAGGVGHAALTLGAGGAMGAVGGLAIAGLLRLEGWVPEGLENITTLALVLALFQGANALLHESGLAAAVMAGLVVGNLRSHGFEELREFKEQLTVLFIGLLFVLLAADVRLADVYGLGWPGVFTVAALMLVVRPLNVLAGTWGTELSWNEKLFMMWLAPRGIVAAAVSALFATQMDAAGLPGGAELQALVFLVIATTVLVQGLTGGLVARALGLSLPQQAGYLFIGANALARAVAQPFRDAGIDVVLIDDNPDRVHAAEEAGFRALYGSGLEERMLVRAEIGARAGILTVLSNEATNLLILKRARGSFKVPRGWVCLGEESRVEAAMVREAGGKVLFGRKRDVDLWNLRLLRDDATVERWRRVGEAANEVPDALLPLVCVRGGRPEPFDDETRVRPDDVVVFAVLASQRAEAEAWLDDGWAAVSDD